MTATAKADIVDTITTTVIAKVARSIRSLEMRSLTPMLSGPVKSLSCPFETTPQLGGRRVMMKFLVLSVMFLVRVGERAKMKRSIGHADVLKKSFAVNAMVVPSR